MMMKKKKVGKMAGAAGTTDARGLQPGKVNVAARARVWANATCGERAPEEFCRAAVSRGDQCGICDLRSSDPNKRHLAAYAVDGSASRWWQSPSLQQGARYQWVTLTLDLKQEYQVSDVIVKAAVSPRPGNWVLEKSVDGEGWQAWHYYAVSDDECWAQYGVRPAPPHPTYKTDTEVVCTSYYSKIKPLEGGEIHTNLVSGRPRVNTTELEEFTRARYVRMRLQKLRASSDFLARSHRDPTLARKLFYSIRDIIISGQCICHGHASKCKYNEQSAETQCECEHNTCGSQCERCCPLFNQEAWQRGGSTCERCQCHGHATHCHYDAHVAAARLSLNVDGAYKGGGVCDNCTDETTGINCEQCKPGWFRPTGVSADAAKPCVKCDCHSLGSTGFCATDDSHAHIGKPAGACECHEGFGGVRCDQCASGYQGFPDCQPCPCDHRGTALHSNCDNGCQCKDNVEGERCDKCKAGFFLLDRDNPKGCMECYCSGVSSQCQIASGYKLQEISTLQGWLVSDISVKRTVLPSVEPESGLISIGNFELPGVENYYWLTPDAYCGDRLASYGSTLTFRVTWVVMRGDTSGKPTVAPDVVILGNNGMKLGFGENWYQQNNISLTVQLLEQGWYHLADSDDDIAFNRFGFRGPAVTRSQLLSVLADVKHILLRAKFHTDQAEASLVSAILETGDKGGGGGAEVGHLEQCSCPEGYAGLSCQSCDFGYTRITPDLTGSGRHQHAVCSKCNCHSHAATCHPVTGECGKCEHNTMGAMCERCLPGYYGDAQGGRGVEDCQRCACPLLDAANNFSPTCDQDSHGGYVCTQCPLGYQGNHCQECAPGYFGNPMIVGSTCEPCECKDGGPCDQLTGQCLRCHGNTEGWRCERCKPAHYGNAHLSDCKPCDCDIHGSVDITMCNEMTGQCQCRDRYIGRSCNQCQDGLGNVTAGCIACQCDPEGSVTQMCDPVTGNCHCFPGVAGAICDQCQPNHYDFSSTGCKSCDCHFLGSKSLACDVDTGDCACKENVVGRTCDTCQAGYWGLSETGCQACACDLVGAVDPATCDPFTGQCLCKPGVQGRTCDRCAPLFYGLSTYGCSECDICDKPGHICDPDTGRCVCPPFTEGADCSRCQRNAWGFAPGLGCKLCNCDPRGSLDAQCNLTTGECACADGFEGTQCSRCGRGFYNFPECAPCDCDLAGTTPHHCHNGVCTCDPASGQCPCKDNVTGKRCSSCKPGTFGLQADLPAGCLECFCFGRSAICSEAGNLVWTQLRTPHPRTLTVDYDNNTTQFAPASSLYPVNTREICYINLAVPGGGEMSLNGDDVSKLNVTNNLRIIPGDLGDVEIGVNFLFDSPLYWQLPTAFLNDKILSYGGFLRFTVETEGSSRLLPPAVLATYPLVQIQGNNKIILEHFPILHNPSSRHEVRFHESLWKMKNNPSIKVTRQMLMIALQNLQHILIRATDTVDFSTALLRDVTLDTAVASPGGGGGRGRPLVGGVEVCACPSQYNATSCQNPSLGFYRYKGSGRDAVSSTIFIQLVGEARPCECNNRSTVCDIETGHCLNCSDWTGGERCERCAEGHYGDPERGVACAPCPCPTANHNLAVSCDVYPDHRETKCHCRQGYTGKRCERCSYGWYGYPEERDGACVRCECNRHGSVSDECHEQTGQCNCRPGITGRDCSQCQPRHILTPKGCTSCDDGCTGLLLDKVDQLEQTLMDRAGHLSGDILLPPWQELMQADGIATDLQDTWEVHQNNTRRLQQLPPTADEDLHKKARQLLNKAKKLEKNCHNTTVHALVLKEEADVLLSEINGLESESKGIVAHLQSYGLSEGQLVSVVAALKEARQHLARIGDTDMEPNALLTLRVLTYCNTTLNELKEKIGDKERLNSLKERLNKLLEQIADMKMIVTGVMGKSNQVIKLNDKNRQMYKNVGKTVDLSLSFEEDVAKLMRDSTDLKNLASVLLGEAEDNIEALRRSSDDLKVLSKAVEEREGILFNLNPSYKEKYVIPAQEHANSLMEQAQKYAELFVPTRQDADFALKASKAYEDIVSALESAKQAARNASAAADIAHEQAYPGIGRDSLLDDASATGVKSKKLLQDAKDQLAHTFELHDQLNVQKEAVDGVRRNVTSASLDDNSIFRQLQKLNSDEVMQTADATLSRADELTETAAKVKETSDDIKKAVQSKLKPQLDKLEALEDISLNSAKDMISEAQDNVKKAQQLLSDISGKAESHNNRFNAWNESVTSKLEALRNKITQARHIADGIRLSLTSRGERGSCIRTYQPSHLEPTTMTSIVLTYAISSQQRDALLFYLPSTSTDDFVAIEMVNRKMRFVWNMGGGVGEVTHPMHIQTAGDLSKDQHWYRVEAERIGNVGRLLVRPQVVAVGSALASARPVSNASAPGVGRLDVRRGDRVWVGGLPTPSTYPSHPHPALHSSTHATTGLVGCLHRLSLDGRPIGLWNFRTQAHAACTACIEGAEEVVEEQAFSFSGDSYAVLTYDSSSAYNKYVFTVSLSFRTLDENALLFHAVGDHPDRFITLTLRQGHVVFRISYGSEWTLETRTVQQYNTGNWTRLEASRYFDRKKKVEKGVLKVEDESRDGSPQRPPTQDAIPDLSGARFFFGGLPPGYHPPPSLHPSTTSFLGCISDVQVMQEGYNLLKGKFWGVQAACSNKPLTVVGFHGDGYLQLASHHLKRKASFGFVFATAQQDALLMLSTFEGLDGPLEDHEEFTNTIAQEQDRLNYYTASIRRGQIEVRLNAGRGEVRLASTGSEYGDSHFHSVAVTKSGRRLELRVDDVVHAAATLPEGATIVKAPPAHQGGLYFGGLPAHFNTTGRTITNIPFIGTIKDAIFNDQLLQFDQPVSFHHALIGRMGPNSMGASDLGSSGGGSGSEMAATMATHGGGGVAGPGGSSGGLTGCRKVSSYTLQPAAVKFGDTPNTHVQMNLRKRSVLQKNYTLELHFRTYYPDGLIFIVPGTPQKRMHYMMGALRNGRLQIVVKGRRKIEMTAQAVLNDGAWHHMTLEKEDRKMTLSVDSIDPEKTKTPKKMNIGPIIYLGGIPEGATSLPESLVSKLPSFKGCMQGMKLNGHMEDLVGDKVKSHKVGQCFPQVERGSYFPGDAYAIYEKKFNVGNLLELELEFRTSEMNGILLSVSQPENYPALSLELHNGKVVMQGDMGDRRPFVVEQWLDSGEFGLCDNRWHRIQASITNNDQLTLRLDQHADQKYWLSDNGHLTQTQTHTNSPLYIGGLPDQASAGMLRTRENFKGCIRNVMIGGQRRDWTEMAALHNILLGSCPLPS